MAGISRWGEYMTAIPAVSRMAERVKKRVRGRRIGGNLATHGEGSGSVVVVNVDGGLRQVVRENWHLGFTAFGGPPVHFKIFHDKFVTKLGWIDEQVYQELFSVCQAFSGPGSTKMLYCINLIRHGFLPAVLGFLIWSLPGALGMLGLAIGVSNIGESLPRVVYALLSGLNAATVGIIALAAVQLAQKAITDKLTRSLVFLGAAAGLLYNALWYFPLLLFIAGVIAVVHDFRWLHGPVRRVSHLCVAFKDGLRVGSEGAKKRRRRSRQEVAEENPDGVVAGSSGRGDAESGIELTAQRESGEQQQGHGVSTTADHTAQGTVRDEHRQNPSSSPLPSSAEAEPRVIPPSHSLSPSSSPTTTTTTSHAPSLRLGIGLIVVFLASFTLVMLLRGLLPSAAGRRPLLYRLFANMYLAGTIIFGGGPVVIPLLREYVVAEGWVSPRDFLIGLALIQGFPGPNFNFAVYLGGLTAVNYYTGRLDTDGSSMGSMSMGAAAVVGAVLGYVGVFAPGLVTVHGTVGIWGAVRGLRWVRSALRGVNAAAVGLIYTAVYRLWQIGWIDDGFQKGTSLANDPWWVVVTATSYVGGCWFAVSPPVACLLGAVLGLVRYAVVQG